MGQRKKNNLTDLLMIHGAVLLFGLAGVISKGITHRLHDDNLRAGVFLVDNALHSVHGHKDLHKAQK